MGVDTFYREFPTGDPGAALSHARDDFRLWPPNHAECIEGRNVVIPLMKAFHEMFEGTFHWVSRAEGDGISVLRWNGTIRGVPAQGVDVFEQDDEGRLSDMKVFMRPVEAVQAMTDYMVEAFGDWENRERLFEGLARGEA